MASAAEFFDGLQDHEFFSSKVNHLFFYDEVSAQSYARFQINLRGVLESVQSARGVRERPKPIVIHVNSPGGDMSYGISLMNLLTEIHVPFAVCVDGFAASAATPMVVAAPYRVMLSAGMIMIHGYIALQFGKARDLQYSQEKVGRMLDHYVKAYLGNTRLDRKRLDALLNRDKFLGADECLRENLVDRVLMIDHRAMDRRFAKYYKANPDYDLSASVNRLLWKTNFNHFHVSSRMSEEVVQGLAQYHQSGESSKPLIVHATSDMLAMPNLFDALPFFAHVYMQAAPTIGIIANDINVVEAIPILACHRRYMYETCNLYVHLVYMLNAPVSTYFYYDDIVDNYALYKDIVRAIFAKTCPRAPKSFLDSMFTTRTILSARECLKLGLIDGVISPIRRSGELVGCKFKDCTMPTKPARRRATST